MAKDLPSFIAQEGAKREGSVIHEKNFIDANNYETVAYLKHLDTRNEPKMVLFENVPALNGQKSEFPMFYNPWVTRQYVADSLDMGEIKSPMEVSPRSLNSSSSRAKSKLFPGIRLLSNKSFSPATKRISEFCPCPCTRKATRVHTTP
jgi:hypothetical protein